VKFTISAVDKGYLFEEPSVSDFISPSQKQLMQKVAHGKKKKFENIQEFSLKRLKK